MGYEACRTGRRVIADAPVPPLVMNDNREDGKIDVFTKYRLNSILFPATFLLKYSYVHKPSIFQLSSGAFSGTVVL